MDPCGSPRSHPHPKFPDGGDDAYFKLEKFEEAKKAYSDALKLDPNNRVAGQGLRLVESQQ